MGKKQRNEFTNREVEIIREHYPTRMPIEDIVALMPRHTYDSIKQYATRELKLKRPGKAITWDALALLLKVKPRTKTEIAAFFGVSTHCVGEAIKEHRKKVYIKTYEVVKVKGRSSAVWTLGNLPDAPAPGRRRPRSRNRVNPFLAAAGMAQIPAGATGRVYKQAMDVENEAVA